MAFWPPFRSPRALGRVVVGCQDRCFHFGFSGVLGVPFRLARVMAVVAAWIQEF